MLSLSWMNASWNRISPLAASTSPVMALSGISVMIAGSAAAGCCSTALARDSRFGGGDGSNRLVFSSATGEIRIALLECSPDSTDSSGASVQVHSSEARAAGNRYLGK